MLIVRLDTQGELEVRWPVKDTQIIALGQAYIKYESSLGEDKQLHAPSLSTMQAALTAAEVAVQSAAGGETTRATAAEVYRQAIAQARPMLETVILHLKSKYAGNLAQLEAWGLKTTSSTRGVSVRKPTDEQKWADFLLAYVQQEQALPTADRIADPPLDKLIALAQIIQSSRAERTAGRTRREMAVESRSAAATRLLDLLQAAAVVRVVNDYASRVTNDLQQWGYSISARTGAGSPPTAESGAG